MSTDLPQIAISIAVVIPMLLALVFGLVAALLTVRRFPRSSGLLGAGLLLALGCSAVAFLARWVTYYGTGFLFSAGILGSYTWIDAFGAIVEMTWGLLHGVAFVLVALAAFVGAREAA